MFRQCEPAYVRFEQICISNGLVYYLPSFNASTSPASDAYICTVFPTGLVAGLSNKPSSNGHLLRHWAFPAIRFHCRTLWPTCIHRPIVACELQVHIKVRCIPPCGNSLLLPVPLSIVSLVRWSIPHPRPLGVSMKASTFCGRNPLHWGPGHGHRLPCSLFTSPMAPTIHQLQQQLPRLAAMQLVRLRQHQPTIRQLPGLHVAAELMTCWS